MSLKVVTWNMGTNIADYYMKTGMSAEEISKTGSRDQVEVEYNKLDSKAAAKYFNTKGMIGDVVMLQEHIYKGTDMPSERAEVETLKSLGYNILMQSKHKWGPDLSIALDNDRFDVIEELSIPNKQTSAFLVIAKDKNTEKIIGFVSMTIAGTPLTGTMQEIESAAEFINKECNEDIIPWIKENCKKCDSIYVGGDFNANPERMKSRFELFTNAGFELLRSGTTTQKNYDQIKSGGYNERELDFFLTLEKKTVLQRVVDIFSKTPKPATPIALGFEDHGSDHSPLQVTFDVKHKAGFATLFKSIFTKIGSLFGKLFTKRR